MVSATAGSVAGGGGGGGPPPGALTDRLQAFVFVPDYTVKAMTDVLYVRITRTTYMRAIKASLMASRKQSGHTGMTTLIISIFTRTSRSYGPSAARAGELPIRTANITFKGHAAFE